jgi:hypothetical protein
MFKITEDKNILLKLYGGILSTLGLLLTSGLGVICLLEKFLNKTLVEMLGGYIPIGLMWGFSKFMTQLDKSHKDKTLTGSNLKSTLIDPKYNPQPLIDYIILYKINR